MKDDEEKTSMESGISIAHLPSAHLREQPKTHDYLNPPTIIEPTISSFDSPNSPSVALSSHPIEQTIREGDGDVVCSVCSPHAIIVTPPLPEQYQDERGLVNAEKEWQIVRIDDKR
jgi:hypothetical protein